MNLIQLRAFDAVVRTGSFTAGARRLHVTQPAVTNHVKALEDYYEVSLFQRRGRGVEPTQLGEELAEIAERLFALENEAVDLLQATKALTRGHLRVAADGPYILVPLVAAFRQRFPGVRVTLWVGSTQDVQTALLEEHYDVSVQAHKEEDPRLHEIQLATYTIVLFVGMTHPWAQAKRQTVCIRDLDKQPVNLREEGSTARLALERACALASVHPDYMIETSSRETVKESVAAGLGVGIISEAELRPDARFWPVRVEDVELSYVESVFCLKRRLNLRIVKEFLKVVADVKRAGAIPRGHRLSS